jgi:uncharacterized protein (DUF1015 family)
MASALIQPFAAIRPAESRAQDVAARPYDVVSFEEARAQAAGRPWSFLHVSRAEIDLDAAVDAHAPEVYAQAARAFAEMQREGVLVREDRPRLYVYRMTAGAHAQTGLAAAASIAAYQGGRIRRHEHTRPDKELDRTRQIAAVGAHTGPVLVAHPPSGAVAAALSAAAGGRPFADATTTDGTRHRLWPVTAPREIELLVAAFQAFPAIYIADGHHRSAAAARLARERGRGEADDDRFLIVSFPADELRILGYHRVVRDLGGLGADALLARLEQAFRSEPLAHAQAPAAAGTFTMCLAGRWYRLTPRTPPAAGARARERLDVSRLSTLILEPILGIGDARTDPRIDFVGGGRGLAELEARVRDGRGAVAFALFPTAFSEVIAVADAGDVMPPKSTWFEPKLADGLLSLPLAD